MTERNEEKHEKQLAELSSELEKLREKEWVPDKDSTTAGNQSVRQSALAVLQTARHMEKLIDQTMIELNQFFNRDK